MTLNYIQSEIRRFGGLTLTGKGTQVSFSRGYCVTIADSGEHIDSVDITKDLLDKYLAKAKAMGGCVEIWQDPADGMVDIYISIHERCEAEAIDLAIGQGQESIFDCHGWGVIYLN